MILCPRCKRENDDKSIYCGYCGMSLIVANIVFDGKKNKKQLNILNKLIKSESFNIFYILSCFVLLVLALFITVCAVKELIDSIPLLNYHINQIIIKYEYILEGVKLSYISTSLLFILDIFILSVILLLALVDIPLIIYFTVLGIVLLISKKRDALSIKKPITMIKLGAFFNKIALIFNIIAILLIIVMFILQLCIK